MSEVRREKTKLSEANRLRLLKEATQKMKNEAALDPDLNLKEIAAQTENYSSSDLELLVRVAQGGALSAQLLRNNGIPTTDGLKLTMEDFTSAMDIVKPTIDSSKDDFEGCSSVP